MDLVKPKDLLKAKPGLTYFGGEYFARFLMHVLRFRKLNKLYGRIEKSQGLQFIDEVIAVLELKVDLDDQELRRIPSTGAAIVVANHPLGGLDGLLMIHYVSQIRSDIKILANHLLKKIEPVSGFFVDTNPFELDADTEESAFAGLKESMAHLKNGEFSAYSLPVRPARMTLPTLLPTGYGDSRSSNSSKK